MAKIAVLDMAGKQVSERELSDAVFAVTPNEAVMHAMVVNYLANQRQGTQSTLTRTEVAGGGRKPWRQKVQVTQDRVPSVLRSGHTAALHWARSPVTIVTL